MAAITFGLAGLRQTTLAAQATFETDAERDITINGIDPADESGVSADTGDVNHDGVTDLVIRAGAADQGDERTPGRPT